MVEEIDLHQTHRPATCTAHVWLSDVSALSLYGSRKVLHRTRTNTCASYRDRIESSAWPYMSAGHVFKRGVDVPGRVTLGHRTPPLFDASPSRLWPNHARFQSRMDSDPLRSTAWLVSRQTGVLRATRSDCCTLQRNKRSSSTSMVRTLLSRKPQLESRLEDLLRVPLLNTCYWQHLATSKILISRGCCNHSWTIKQTQSHAQPSGEDKRNWNWSTEHLPVALQKLSSCYSWVAAAVGTRHTIMRHVFLEHGH